MMTFISRPIYILGICIITLFLSSCATLQSRYVILEKSYPPLPEGYEIEVFRNGLPERPFIKVSRLDVHLEKTHFISSNLDNTLPELKRQAHLSGAQAIIEIQERSSMVGETKIYHVTAIGIRYIDTAKTENGGKRE